MPIHYAIDRERDIVRVVWTDRVDDAAFAAHLQKMLSDPEALRCRRSLSDLRGAELTMLGAQLKTRLRGSAAPMLGDSPWTVAILVKSPAQYGTARQFEAFAEGIARNAIFHDEAEALAWLEQMR